MVKPKHEKIIFLCIFFLSLILSGFQTESSCFCSLKCNLAHLPPSPPQDIQALLDSGIYTHRFSSIFPHHASTILIKHVVLRLILFQKVALKYLIVLRLQCGCLDLHRLRKCLKLEFVSHWEQMVHHRTTE